MRTLVFCFWLALVLPAAGVEIKFDFGNYSEGNSLTNDFYGALAGSGQPGDWKIVMDEVPPAFAPISSNAPTADHVAVLEQADTDPTDSRFPMLLYRKETFKDFRLKMQFKIVSGVVEQMAGVVFHFENESNFYVVRVSALGHNLRFYKVINGQFADPQNVAMNISTGVWHSLAVECSGSQINLWYDDHFVAQMQTTQTIKSGKIGFWTMADSLTHFGYTTIAYKPVVPMAELLIQNVMQEEPRLLGLRIYTMDKGGVPRVIASKDPKEVGKAGSKAEKGALTDGTIFFGRGKGTVAVTMPLNDRNGDPIAAVRVQMDEFFGETQDTAVERARAIVQLMQTQVMSEEDLMQ